MHILSPETDNCPSWISGRERMTVENISWSISTKECCRPRRGLNLRPPGRQSDSASNWATKAGLHLCRKVRLRPPQVTIVHLFIPPQTVFVVYNLFTLSFIPSVLLSDILTSLQWHCINQAFHQSFFLNVCHVKGYFFLITQWKLLLFLMRTHWKGNQFLIFRAHC